jgi:glycosyltransferase involved in cell wall biosynthesis
MPEPQRLLVVEEALKDKRGHWYEYNRAIVAEARRRGISTTVLAHARIEPDLARELGATPFFPVTSWDGVYYHPSSWRRYAGILRHNLLIARMVGAYFEKQPRFDVVLVPTVVLYHWLAWRWLAWRGKGRWFDKLVLTTRNNAGEYDPASSRYVFKSSARALTRIVRSFRAPVRRGEVELASDSERIARQYQELCGIPFRVYPHPVEDGEVHRASAPRDPSRVTFGALGPPRFEKGSDLVLDAIGIVRRAGGDRLRFIVQWTGDCHDIDGRRIIPGDDIERDPAVTLLTADLSSAEYQARLAECDVLLLPYRRAQYHARLSGVAIEAFRRAIPCICFGDTWLADAMTRFGAGEVVAEESASALADAILRISNDLPRYAAGARERSGQARAYHSPGTFVDMLFQPRGPG